MASNSLEKLAPEIATEIIFLRTSNTRTALIVEGSSDIKFFERFLDVDACDVISADGKENALAVVDELTASGFDGFLAIVDRDHDALLGENFESDRVVYSDDNDLDVMLFRSSAFDAVLMEWGSRAKANARGGAGEVRDAIAATARMLGALRLYARQEGIPLKFEDAPLGAVCRRTLNVDLGALVQAVYNHSRRPQPTYQNEIATVTALAMKHSDPWALCCGHDLSALFGKALQGYCGTCNQAEVKPEWIERLLRLAYDTSVFDQTILYGKIRAWEWANRPYRALRAA